MASEELAWIEESECAAIESVHGRLKDEFPGWPDAYPADLTHDLQICRFLRGHGQSADKAIDAIIPAIKHRMEIICEPAVAEMRQRVGQATQLDLKLVPYQEDVLRCLPFRILPEGLSTDGCPIILVALRFVEYDMVGDVEEMVAPFLRAMMEQRALVLNNRSLLEKRMAKFVEVRDFNGAWVSSILTQGRGLVGKLKGFIKSVQEFYPEVMPRS